MPEETQANNSNQVIPVNSELLKIGTFDLDPIASLKLVKFFSYKNRDVRLWMLSDDLLALAEQAGKKAKTLATTVRFSELRTDTSLQSILDQLGNENDVKVALADVARMLKAQGKRGPLRTSECANLFPLGNGQFIACYSCSNGWISHLFPVSSDTIFPQGCRVFYR